MNNSKIQYSNEEEWWLNTDKENEEKRCLIENLQRENRENRERIEQLERENREMRELIYLEDSSVYNKHCIIISNNKTKCIARQYATGKQCTNNVLTNTSFCRKHNTKYTEDNKRKKKNCKKFCCDTGSSKWEHCGKCDQHPRHAGAYDDMVKCLLKNGGDGIGWFGE